ncbi:MAG: hypothetical protein ACYS22_17185 [Planctomycetota bacterium]
MIQSKKTRWVQGVGFGVVLAFGGALSGCQNIERIEIPNFFRPMPERPLADVPVPVGFRFRENGSYVFNNNYRVAKLRYAGGRQLDEVEAFYKENMPLSQWEFTGDSGAKKRVITFQKDWETCTVTLMRDHGRSAINIEISPREVASAERAAEQSAR